MIDFFRYSQRWEGTILVYSITVGTNFRKTSVWVAQVLPQLSKESLHILGVFETLETAILEIKKSEYYTEEPGSKYFEGFFVQEFFVQ